VRSKVEFALPRVGQPKSREWAKSECQNQDSSATGRCTLRWSAAEGAVVCLEKFFQSTIRNGSAESYDERWKAASNRDGAIVAFDPNSVSRGAPLRPEKNNRPLFLH
jgi:hypothetical protein